MAQVIDSFIIDGVASNGGVGALCVPLITTGDPPAILDFARQLADRLRQFVGVLADLERCRDQLRQLWTGTGASDAAIAKLAKAFDTFHRTIDVLTKFIQELEAVAGKLDMAQRGHNAAVRAAEPTVASLAATPWTRPAATALATGTTMSIAGFLQGIGSLFSAIGQTNLGGLVSSLGTIANSVSQLSSSGSGSTGGTPVAGFLPVAPGTGTAATAGTVSAVSTISTLGPAPAPAVSAPHHFTVTVEPDGTVRVDADVS